MSGNISQLLMKSEAVQSLKCEREICNLLQQERWGVVHSAFYIDATTLKDRETDVAARQIWEQKVGDAENIYRLHLLIEVKTLKDFHIITSPPISLPDFYRSTRYWPGYDESLFAELRSVLDQKTISTGDADEFTEELSGCAFSVEHPLPLDLINVTPFHAARMAGAFRETNTKTDKELESSVLWKASLTLRSSYISNTKSIRESHASWLGRCVDVVEHLIDRSNAATQFRMVDFFHPVVVLQAPLWTLSGDSIEQADWIRFVQLNHSGEGTWWFDAVNHDFFPRYAKLATDYYANSLKRLGAKQRSI